MVGFILYPVFSYSLYISHINFQSIKHSIQMTLITITQVSMLLNLKVNFCSHYSLTS